MFSFITNIKFLSSSLLQSRFANLESSPQYSQSEKKSLNNIHNIFKDNIKDDNTFERWFQAHGGKVNTKKEIIEKYLGKDIEAVDEGLIDKQIGDLQKEMISWGASKKEIQEATKNLLQDIHDYIGNSIGGKIEWNDDVAINRINEGVIDTYDIKHNREFKKQAIETLNTDIQALTTQITVFDTHQTKDIFSIQDTKDEFQKQIDTLHDRQKKLGQPETLFSLEKFDTRVEEIEAEKKAVSIRYDNLQEYLKAPNDIASIPTLFLLDKKSAEIKASLLEVNQDIEELGMSQDPLDMTYFSQLVEKRKQFLIAEAIKEKGKVTEAMKKLSLPEDVLIHTDVFTRTLKRGMHGADVIALQEFLGITPDGTFGNQTEYALKAYQKKYLGHKTPDGILSVSKSKLFPTLAAIKDTLEYRGSLTNIYRRKANYEQVKSSIDTADKRMDALIQLIENSDEFYQALEAWIDGGFRDDILSDMGGVLGIFRGATGFNKADEYFDKLKSYDEMVSEKEDRFNEEIEKLIPKGDHTKLTQREKSSGGYLIRDVLIGIVFQDYALFDIRFNFAKRLASFGVPMDKALAFKQWFENGMEGEPNYSEENLKEISGVDAWHSLGTLRANLTAYGFSADKIHAALHGDIQSLSEKEKKLFRVIIEQRVLPDLKTLNRGGFNVIEKMADGKYGRIKQLLNKLEGKNYRVENEIISHNAILKRYGNYYVLEVDDWGRNTYRAFEKRPSRNQILEALKDYKNTDKNSENKQWSDDFVIISDEWIDIIPAGEGYILKYHDTYKKFDHRPTKEELKGYITSRAYESWPNTKKQGEYNDDISTKEVLQDIGKMISLFEEQYEEGRGSSFGLFKNEELEKGLQRVKNRDTYMRGIFQESVFLENAVRVLSTADRKLFEKYSVIKVFGNMEGFLSAFPASKYVDTQLRRLSSPSNQEEYVDILKEVLRDKRVTSYLNIVQNASGSGDGMKKWHKYRRHQISKYRGLKRVNDSKERTLKYGEVLPVDITPEDALKKMKSETTFRGAETPSRSVLGNVESGLVDIGITDVTSKDIEGAINKKWDALDIDTFEGHLINTANRKGFSFDSVNTIGDLKKRGDTHIFHTQIEKEFVIYKKNGDKVLLQKTYDLYIRPECNNILVLPESKHIGETLLQKDFDVDISSLKTRTVSITWNMLSYGAKKVKGIFEGNPSTQQPTSGNANISGGENGGGGSGK